MAAKIGLLSLVLMTFTLHVCAAEPVIPQGYLPERYERIWKKSPFTVASVIAPEAVDNSTFADSLTLAGLITIGGKPLVTVVANDSQETFLVDGDTPNSAGLQVVSFVNDLDPSKVEVVLKKGDATGTLHFTINETPSAEPEQSVEQPVEQPGPRRIIQPRPGGTSAPGPVQPRVLPRTSGPVMPQPAGGQIIRRRQLQLPGANRQNPNVPQSNAIPPPK